MAAARDAREIRVTRILIGIALFFIAAGTYHTIAGSGVGVIGAAVGAVLLVATLWRRRSRPWQNRLFSVLTIVAFGCLLAGAITSLDLYIVGGLTQLTILGVAAIALWGHGVADEDAAS